MSKSARKTMQLGELIAAAFDTAAQHSLDPRRVSHLAAIAVTKALRGARESRPSEAWPYIRALWRPRWPLEQISDVS
jgi:hypothetical protein